MAKRKLVSLDPDLESALNTVKRLEGTPETEQVRRALREWFMARGVLRSQKVPTTPGGNRARVLADHTRVGKRFVPPLMQLGPMEDVSWSVELIPEFLWLGLLNERLGIVRGAEMGLAIARAAVQATGTSKKKVWFGPISTFGCLRKAAQADIIKTLTTSGALDSARSALLPMITLYPDCPLGFIDRDLPRECRDDVRAAVLNQIRSMRDRSSRHAMMVQANAIYMAFVTGVLKVFKGSILANFPAIEQYPSTEESKMVASAVRAGINGMFGPIDRVRSKAWVSHFWKRGFEIDDCTFAE
jgi:hypothetical protein